jgi:predicted DNA-binding ribbon-helix-helix protein
VDPVVIQESTTVRVSRRTHQTLTELAERRQISVTELVERLAERERRHDMLRQYNARMAELLADPDERAALEADRAWLDASAGAPLADEPRYPL